VDFRCVAKISVSLSTSTSTFFIWQINAAFSEMICAECFAVKIIFTTYNSDCWKLWVVEFWFQFVLVTVSWMFKKVPLQIERHVCVSQCVYYTVPPVSEDIHSFVRSFIDVFSLVLSHVVQLDDFGKAELATVQVLHMLKLFSSRHIFSNI